MKGTRWILFALAASAAAVTLRTATPAESGGSLPHRLLGPVSSLAAGWQWVRVRMALDAGRRDLAYSRAELALELDPTATDAWAWLASNMAFDRASPYREPSPELRTRWTELALDFLRRGEASARRPADLALQAGLILVRLGEAEGAIPWPGGTAAAWREAQENFVRATELDPGLTEAWVQRAAHRSLRLGDPLLEPARESRVQALVAALEVLEEGREPARRPEDLDFERGLLLAAFADGGDGDAWPGGRVALYQGALEAFERAHAGHHPLAHGALDAARVALEAARAD